MKLKLPPLVVILSTATGCGRATSPWGRPADRFAVLAPASVSTDPAAMFEPPEQSQWSQARSRLRAFAIALKIAF